MLGEAFKLGFIGEDVAEASGDESVGGIYSPHTPQKGSRHIARHDEYRNFDDFGSRDMAGAFSGGSGGIDTPRAPVTKVSVTSSPTNQKLPPHPLHKKPHLCLDKTVGK